MPQGTSRKRRPALLIGLALVVVACATPRQPTASSVVAPAPVQTAKTLEHIESLTVVGLGSGDLFKRAVFGADNHTLERPTAVAVRNGSVLVADGGVNAIFRYGLATRRMEKIADVGAYFTGDASSIYIASDGSFYVTDPLGQQALRFSYHGKLLQVYHDAANLSRPIAIAVDEAQGEVLIADEVYSHIVVFSAEEGRPLLGMGDRGRGAGRFRIITDMAAAAEGYYVSDRVENRMQLLDKQGQFVMSFGQADLVFPQAIAVSDDGYVFVADRADNRIKVFHRGELIDTVGRNGSADGEFRLIADMAAADNRLYVADSLNQRVQVFRIKPPGDAATAP